MSDSLSYPCGSHHWLYAELVANRLKEIAEDEKNHAIQLRDRITALGGTPTMEVDNKDLIHAKTLKEILDVNIREEERAIQLLL
jgi:bacterioferritin (cytochrome b1)